MVSRRTKIHYSLGAAHFVYDLNKAEALEDSLKLAKKLAEQKSADTTKKAAVKKMIRNTTLLKHG